MMLVQYVVEKHVDSGGDYTTISTEVCPDINYDIYECVYVDVCDSLEAETKVRSLLDRGCTVIMEGCDEG